MIKKTLLKKTIKKIMKRFQKDLLSKNINYSLLSSWQNKGLI